MDYTYALAIHGGAGAIRPDRMDDEKRDRLDKALRKALSAGREILVMGGTAKEAVERSVRTMEDCESFNAGKGSVFSHDGTHEMEASIMTGHDLQAGAVAGLRSIRNPISLAREVMEHSDFVMMSGRGAEEFAATRGIVRVPDSYFFSQLRHNQWQRALKRDRAELDHTEAHPESGDTEDKKMGTVGAVALDKAGDLAAATSTGGLTNKKYNRIGDSPVIGAGTYANNRTCAVSCTGYGEYFLRAMAAYDVSCLVEYKGLSLPEACNEVVKNKLVGMGGEGGLIALDRRGEPVLCFNTDGMYRAWQSEGEAPHIAMFG